LPDEAAAWARAVRDNDDDLGSRSPPNIDWLYILYLRSGSGCPLTSNGHGEKNQLSERFVPGTTIALHRHPLWAAALQIGDMC
jgi:hypothetical protein